MIDLSGKTILVIGASGLIGSAITDYLAQCGSTVLPTYYSHPETLEASSFPGGGEILPAVELDVNNLPSISLLEKMAKALRGIDGLVYCAGINRPAPFDQIILQDWLDIIDVNLTGAFQCTQALLPMVKDGGSVVFIGSVSGHIGGKVSSHYCVAKSGVSALAANIGLFAAPRGIRCNCIAPGYVRSPMAEVGAHNKMVQDTIAQIPLKRLAEPGDISPMVAFLMDDKLSGYITCQTIHINAGLYF